MSRKIPAIMYHTVGVPKPDWLWNFLTIPYGQFENQMRFLKKKGYRTLTSDEFYDCHKRGEYPEKSVYLTFDDGYLDNWVFAAPILEKYGFCGTIFVNPDFVDPSAGCRPQYGEMPVEELQCHGFLNWDEMRSMEKSGVMEIQSHAMTHTWYFSGPEIVDFHHPGDDHVWMDWNDNPGRKWAYLGPEAHHGAWGAPVYEHHKSLSGRIYSPDPAIHEEMVGFCRRRGEGFFEDDNWRDVLRGKFEVVRDAAGPGKMETEQEYLDRVRWELTESKRILESELGKSVEFFCWPGGGYSEKATDIAASVYKAATVSSSQRDSDGFDERGFFRMGRIGALSIEMKGGLYYPGGLYTHLFLKEYKGDPVARFFRRVGKALILLKGLLNF